MKRNKTEMVVKRLVLSQLSKPSQITRQFSFDARSPCFVGSLTRRATEGLALLDCVPLPTQQADQNEWWKSVS